MGIHRGEEWKAHLVCYTGRDLSDLREDLLEEAQKMTEASYWRGFDDLESVCVDEEKELVVGTTSINSDNEILFLVDRNRRQEGIATLMVESLMPRVQEATEESVLSGDWSPPYSAVAGSEEGASFLHSLSGRFGWKAWALIDWSGFDEEKAMFLEDRKRIANIKRKRLYRAGHSPIWTGTGSYWFEDVPAARRHGKSSWHGAPPDTSPHTEVMAADIHYPSERLLDLRLEGDMIDVLSSLGIPMESAERHVVDNDWSLDPACLGALRTRYDWVRKPVGDTNDIEWVHLVDDDVSGWYLMRPIPLIDNEWGLSKQVYVWKDGSEAVLRLNFGEEPYKLLVVRSGEQAKDVALHFDDWRPDRALSVCPEEVFSPIFEKKLRGFLSDIGVHRPSESWPGMVLDSVSGKVLVPWPRWVPDEVWRNRMEAAKKHVYPSLPAIHHRRDFMGIPGFAIVEAPPPGETQSYAYQRMMGWRAEWWSRGDSNPAWSETFDGAVDASLELNFIYPESRREQWEAENIERGVFVLPTPEEAEMFRLLDEPIPYWWPFDQLLTWLRERP